VFEISNSVGTQLANNKWIYFVPTIESIAVFCMDKPPVDVIVLGTENLGISANCKGFGKSVLFQTHSILTVDNPGYESDFMSRVHLEYDCCEELNVQFNSSTVSFNTSFKNIVSHLDNLKTASHRISDVENMIREQEWKSLHTSSHNTYSALVYICIILIGLYMLYKLYNCLNGKVSCIKAVTDTNGSGNILNIKIPTSNESLAMAQEDVPLR